MHQRPLGQTGLHVSPLAFGTFKIGRNEKIKYPQPYDLPDERQVAELLDGVLELGINLLDTAPAYGLSEELLGRCLGPRRAEFVLSTKVGETFVNGESQYDFTESAVRQSVQRSLKRLQTDALDLVLIHTPHDDVRVLRETPVVETLQQLKQAGWVRAIGLSGKTVEAAQLALDWADVLMLEYHLHDTSMREIISAAKQCGLGVLIKKGLASGHLHAAEAIPFVLQTPGVSSLVIGGLSLAHLRENVALASACPYRPGTLCPNAGTTRFSSELRAA